MTNDYEWIENITLILLIRIKIGDECLILTNEFGKKENLPVLLWDDGVYEHSDNMGIYKVKVGHDMKDQGNCYLYSMQCMRM